MTNYVKAWLIAFILIVPIVWTIGSYWLHQSRLKKYLRRWIDQIARDQGCDLKGLLEHIKHHADEGLVEGVGDEWLASMVSLMDIIRVMTLSNEPTVEKRIERLFLHWHLDQANMTSPPQGDSTTNRYLSKKFAQWASLPLPPNVDSPSQDQRNKNDYTQSSS